jgi:hypothetical protein
MSAQLSPEASAFIQNLFDARGATLLAFAEVEWYLAKLILEARAIEQYKDLELSFTQDAEKRADRLKEVLNVEGPFSPYADELRKTVDEVMKAIELRTFAAHGLIVRVDPDDFSLSSKLHLRMFRMYKGGKLEDLTLKRTLQEYSEEQRALTKAAGAFGLVVRKLWIDLKLKQLDPE